MHNYEQHENYEHSESHGFNTVLKSVGDHAPTERMCIPVPMVCIAGVSQLICNVGMGILVGNACTLPSLHLVSVGFGNTGPFLHPSTFLENVSTLVHYNRSALCYKQVQNDKRV